MSSSLRELTPDRFARISRLLDESLELAPQQRHTWLSELEGRDPEAALLLRRLFAAQETGEAARFVNKLGEIAALAPGICAEAPLIDRCFGPYRILSLLGHGGMGSVWLAERVDGLFTRRVALKLVHPILGPMLNERFSREREILASLSHAHIARLFDAGIAEDGQPYLALEYVEGAPLTRHCDEHRLGVAARLQLFRQVLSAVQYAHAHLVIHRDLKPSNILVTAQGEAQLLDFGIAKLLTDGSSAHETELTQLGGRALTPDYAAPEQIVGGAITTQADVYSLGVIFYELLTGARPYRLKRDSRGALEDAILQAEPVVPSRAELSEPAAAARDTTARKLAKALAGDLDTIALKALKKVPAERYATVNALDEDIARFLRGELVLAQPDNLAYRARKFVGRHRLAFAAATALITTLAGGMAMTGHEARLAAAQRDQALLAQRQLLTQAAAARLNLGDSSGAMGIMRAVLAQPQGATPEALNVFQGARAADTAVLALIGHTARVNYASFSPDGTRVVTASQDHSVRIWDARTGLELQQLTGHTEPVVSAEFSPDSRRVVTGSVDGTARLWDAYSGRELRQFRAQGDHVNTATFSPDGHLVLVSSDDKLAYLWDVERGALIRTFVGHSDRVASAEFSPDGRLVATAGDDNTARIWDAASGRPLRVLRGHSNHVWFAAFSPDGRRLVTASYDKTARVWDVATGQTLLQLRGHHAQVSSATYSPDGRYIVTAGIDSTAIIWDAVSGELVRTLPGSGTDRVWYAAFSPDGQRVVTASDDAAARIWDIAPRGQLQLLRGHTGPVNSARFSSDGREVVTASDDTTARLWDAATGRELQRFTGHTGAVPSAAFSPDGRLIVTASNDRTARIWEIATGRELRQFKHDDMVTAALLSHDGKRLVTASIDRTAHVWDATTGRHLVLLSGHTDIVNSAAFSPDDTQILTGSSDQTARLWDARSGRQLLVLRGHTGQVWMAHFSADGRRILTAASDHTARLWDARNGAEVSRLTGLSENVPAAAFSPDGERVVLTLDDRTARIWDLASNRQTLALSGHRDVMQYAAFAPDGLRIVTASDDATARIWDTSTPPLSTQISWVAAAEFDPLSSTQRAALGLAAPADVRSFAPAFSTCDQLAGAPYDPDRRAAGVAAAQVDSAPAITACAAGGAERSARETYEYGRALAADNQARAARAQLEQALARGYRAAGVDLARLLVQPPAAPTDVTRATLLLEHAWSQGVPFAAFELGALYERGAGGASVAAAQAWTWYRRGADAAEPHALARFGRRELQGAQTAGDAPERRRHQLAAFRFYASAAEQARRDGWPDEAWRNWRLQRASLARLLALDGGMQAVAAAYDAALRH